MKQTKRLKHNKRMILMIDLAGDSTSTKLNLIIKQVFPTIMFTNIQPKIKKEDIGNKNAPTLQRDIRKEKVSTDPLSAIDEQEY